ncbi:MAG TPA: NAD(P)-binding domain-containing protein [Thermoleophilaceae bacterium]|nr:NAD(P)-binding domain-containing protein [Thermoleophilaceae bacterium]
MERREAIVAGAGAAGLATAAVLRRRGFDVLVIERGPAVGMRWRERYEGLRLNTLRVFSTLPGYRFERRYGRFPRREDFVQYLDRYAAHHGLDIRFGTELRRVDPAGDGGWRLDTSEGPLDARFAVVATGYDAVPHMPAWPGREGFAGELIHASEFRAAADYAGRDVLVVGAGNTGIDIAGHLLEAGAGVTLAMRTPPNVFPRQWGGFPLQPLAIAGESQPAKIADATGFLLQRAIYGNLAPHGIPRAPEGVESRFRRTLVGAAVDDGFVAALKAGRTRVTATIERFDGREVVLTDQTRLTPDAVICATGYRRGLEPIVGHLGVLRPDGLPIRYLGAPELPSTPRLYFAGFWGGNGGQIRWVPKLARRIGRAAARDRTSTIP